jgi:hypothetical protein
MPVALGRVLSVVRKLIDYGKHLAATIQQRADTAPHFAHFARPFGTADIAAILARITAGLRRAALGQDLTPPPVRVPTAGTPRPPRQGAPPDAQPALQPAAATEDSRLARLPTEAEIAAEIRRRLLGAVIADICRDLGIAPGQFDRASWNELSHTIIAYGGSLASFVTNLHKGAAYAATLTRVPRHKAGVRDLSHCVGEVYEVRARFDHHPRIRSIVASVEYPGSRPTSTTRPPQPRTRSAPTT